MVTVVRRDPDKAYIDTWLWVPKNFVNLDGLKRSLTHEIPDRYSGKSTVIYMYLEARHHIFVPRAFWDTAALPFEVIDCRPSRYQHIAFSSRIKLDHRLQELNGTVQLLPTGRNVQQESLLSMHNGMGGVLQLACGLGKTCIALQHIADAKVPALVLVDNTQLMEQWRQEIIKFLDVPGGIGILGDGKREWQKGLVIGTYQTIANWSDTIPEEIRRWFGGIYWDEGHHLSAPIFSKTAPLFYGKRYCLTATPERTDGLHIIADMHVGRVLYKNLSQPLKAQTIFCWTGLSLDLTDPQCTVLDKNREIHMSKVFQYFGRWRKRLDMIIRDCRDAVASGRRVLLVGSSVNEVVNLMALWTRGPQTSLVTDIPYPLPHEVGETLNPIALSDLDAKKLLNNLERARKNLAKAKSENPINQNKIEELEIKCDQFKQTLAQYSVHRKLEALYERKRNKFLKELINEPSTAGIMTYGVPVTLRQQFVQTRSVTFAIMKYGKEGLDAPHLDTVLVSTPFSSKGGLQQLRGRITGRPMPGKKSCLVVIYRDDIGVIHGMCEKLEKHMRTWPVDEGGPLEYTHINSPRRTRCQIVNLQTAYGL